MPTLHASDLGSAKGLKKFKQGQKVAGRVLTVDPGGWRVTLAGRGWAGLVGIGGRRDWSLGLVPTTRAPGPIAKPKLPLTHSPLLPPTLPLAATRKVTVTLKPSLVGSKLPAITRMQARARRGPGRGCAAWPGTFPQRACTAISHRLAPPHPEQDAAPGGRSHGVVTGAADFGVFVAFFGGVTGGLPGVPVRCGRGGWAVRGGNGRWAAGTGLLVPFHSPSHSLCTRRPSHRPGARLGVRAGCGAEAAGGVCHWPG